MATVDYLLPSAVAGLAAVDRKGFELVETQQAIIRELVARRVRLADFRRAERPPPRRPAPSPRKVKEDEPAE